MNVASFARRHSGRLAALILAFGVLEVAASVLLILVNANVPAREVATIEATFAVMPLTFVVVGALTVWRRPENRVAWLFAYAGVLVMFSELCSQYALYALVARADPLPFAVLAAWLASWVWVPAFGPFLTLLLLWFPDGHPPSPAWRHLERVAIGLVALLTPLVAFAHDPESSAPYRNPLATPSVTDLLAVVFPVITLAFPILVSLCAASLVVRFRRATGETRQQVKWVMLAAALIALYILLDSLGVVGGDLLGLAAMLSLPLAAAIAILKYRLYDIDLILNRTLVYGTVTASLAAAYFLIVVALRGLLAGARNESDLAVVASTLAVAALFRPLRTRIQGFIDRRFYRRKYDAARALADFSARLRDEVELPTLRADLLAVVRETVQPAHASLWLRESHEAAR